MASSALSDSQLWTVVTGAGFTGQDAITAFAIALAESGGRPDAVNRGNSNKSVDYGLFQINSIHKDLLSGGNWSDPLANARMAKAVFDRAGRKFTPWTVYKTGAYVGFLARAQKASISGGAQASPGTGASAGASAGIVGTGTSDSDVGKKIADVTAGSLWVRVAYFVVGAILLLMLTASLIKNSGVVSKVAKLTPVGRVLKAVK